jgi:hypothetical protein
VIQPDPASDGEQVSSDDASDPSGPRVILWLFVALSAGTALALLYFAMQVDPQYRPRIYAALVGDLGIPLIAWQLFRVIEERRARTARGKE